MDRPEALFASIKVSFLAGIILSLPVVFYQVWKFIEPALLPNPSNAGLFPCSYWPRCSLRWAWSSAISSSSPGHRFLRELRYGSRHYTGLGRGTYIDFNVKFLLIFGCAFELPLVLTLLSRLE